MNDATLPSLEELLPHSGSMLLLDGIVDHTEEITTCRIEPARNEIFIADGAVPAWVGLEYMGQAACAHVLLKTRDSDSGPAGGILVSARGVSMNLDAFELDRRYHVEATHVLEQGRLQSCRCSIRERDGANVLMEGRLNALVSDDLDNLRGAGQ